MDNDERSHLTMWLEGFEDPLNVLVDRDIVQAEFEALSKELIRNYMLYLRDKGRLAEGHKDLIIIDDVTLDNARNTIKSYLDLM